jgi:hypothetical protein
VTSAPSPSATFQARLAIALIVGLIVLGIVCYGLSREDLNRVWKQILARPGGPMTFRFILQPAMAAIAATRDGVNDARMGRRPYFWSLLRGVRDPEGRSGRLWEGIVSTARILILGVVMDVIYQLSVLPTFHPAEAALVALLLAFLPYLLLRGPVERIARWRIDKASGASR